jgi:hypothetical protein
MPLGGIIGIRNVTNCIEMTVSNIPVWNDPERMLGCYEPGRMMIMSEPVKVFKKIIPFRGRQGLFNVPDEALRVCRVCGCSEFNACPGGCAWVEEDLCSTCVGGGGRQ